MKYLLIFLISFNVHAKLTDYKFHKKCDYFKHNTIQQCVQKNRKNKFDFVDLCYTEAELCFFDNLFSHIKRDHMPDAIKKKSIAKIYKLINKIIKKERFVYLGYLNASEVMNKSLKLFVKELGKKSDKDKYYPIMDAEVAKMRLELSIIDKIKKRYQVWDYLISSKKELISSKDKKLKKMKKIFQTGDYEKVYHKVVEKYLADTKEKMSKKEQRSYAIALLHFDYDSKVRKFRTDLAKEITQKTDKGEDYLGFWDGLDIQMELENITAKQAKRIKKDMLDLHKYAKKIK